MATYKVELSGKNAYVVGLRWREYADTLLMVRYPEGDCDSPSNAPGMHAALYDLYQVDDNLKSGDTFTTPFGNFACYGVHVLTEAMAEEVAATAAAAERLRLCKNNADRGEMEVE